MYDKISKNIIINNLKKLGYFQGSLQVFHTSPTKINNISESYSYFSGCLFFSGDIYVMGPAAPYIYVLDLNEDEIIDRTDLEDPSTIQEIMNLLNVDEETAEDLLTGRQTLWDTEYSNNIAEDDWRLQGKAGKAAYLEGYSVCRDQDEQGTVYIKYLVGKESELMCLNDIVSNKLDEYNLSVNEDTIDDMLEELDLSHIVPTGEFYTEIINNSVS